MLNSDVSAQKNYNFFGVHSMSAHTIGQMRLETVEWMENPFNFTRSKDDPRSVIYSLQQEGLYMHFLSRGEREIIHRTKPEVPRLPKLQMQDVNWETEVREQGEATTTRVDRLLLKYPLVQLVDLAGDAIKKVVQSKRGGKWAIHVQKLAR